MPVASPPRRKRPEAAHLLGNGREPLGPPLRRKARTRTAPTECFRHRCSRADPPGSNGFHPWEPRQCPALPQTGVPEWKGNVRWAVFLITIRCWAWSPKPHRGTLPGLIGPSCATTTPTRAIRRHRGRTQTGMACCFNEPWRPMRSWQIPSGVPATTGNTTHTRCLPPSPSLRLPRSPGSAPRPRDRVAENP